MVLAGIGAGFVCLSRLEKGIARLTSSIFYLDQGYLHRCMLSCT